MQQKEHFNNILLIDDDQDDCRLFQEALAMIAPTLQLECLYGTDQLWKAIENSRPFLICVDFKLTAESGIDCVRQIKAHPDFKNIPVVMWSTSTFNQVVSEAYSAGVQLFFEKPWELKVLADELREIIRLNCSDFALPNTVAV